MLHITADVVFLVRAGRTPPLAVQRPFLKISLEFLEGLHRNE